MPVLRAEGVLRVCDWHQSRVLSFAVCFNFKKYLDSGILRYLIEFGTLETNCFLPVRPGSPGRIVLAHNLLEEA